MKWNDMTPEERAEKMKLLQQKSNALLHQSEDQISKNEKMLRQNDEQGEFIGTRLSGEYLVIYQLSKQIEELRLRQVQLLRDSGCEVNEQDWKTFSVDLENMDMKLKDEIKSLESQISILETQIADLKRIGNQNQ